MENELELIVSEDLDNLILKFKGIFYNAPLKTKIIQHKWFAICLAYNRQDQIIRIAKNGEVVFVKQDKENLASRTLDESFLQTSKLGDKSLEHILRSRSSWRFQLLQ